MKLTVNSVDVKVDDRHAKTPLLSALRDVLPLNDQGFHIMQSLRLDTGPS
jgi:hypothetical protein